MAKIKIKISDAIDTIDSNIAASLKAVKIAYDKANEASNTASNALSTANTANTNATNAINIGNNALSKANTAQSTANTANSNINSKSRAVRPSYSYIPPSDWGTGTIKITLPAGGTWFLYGKFIDEDGREHSMCSYYSGGASYSTSSKNMKTYNVIAIQIS